MASRLPSPRGKGPPAAAAGSFLASATSDDISRGLKLDRWRRCVGCRRWRRPGWVFVGWIPGGEDRIDPDDVLDGSFSPISGSFSEVAVVPAARLLGQGLLRSQGEVHQKQRRLVQPAFHPLTARALWHCHGRGGPAARDRGPSHRSLSPTCIADDPHHPCDRCAHFFLPRLGAEGGKTWSGGRRPRSEVSTGAARGRGSGGGGAGFTARSALWMRQFSR